jgi:hypothetical protein
MAAARPLAPNALVKRLKKIAQRPKVRPRLELSDRKQI